MSTTRYRSIKRWANRTGKCPVCGKRVSRSRTFEQTVNPYHPAIIEGLGVLGVVDSVEKEAREWVPDFTHEKCLKGRPGNE